MELSEKIQKLRKERGMTQEQFAERLFVSRTAVSKWETGRGIPSIESLQMIAGLCGISLDELLGAEEIAAAAGNENKENMARFALYVDGMVCAAAGLSLFLPLYKAQINDVFFSLPLYQFTGRFTPLYWFIPVMLMLCGVVQVLSNKSEREKLRRFIWISSLILNSGAVFVFILSGQPYPALMYFALLLIRGAVSLMMQK